MVLDHFRHTLKALTMDDQMKGCRKCETELGESVSCCPLCAASDSSDEE